MEKQLYEALKYAYELLLDQAETGHYPLKALAENGGKGYEPIQTAIKACESQKSDTGESNCTIFDVKVMLPDNAVPHDIAKEFTDAKLQVVGGLLEEDYKTGYREGITHYLEEVCEWVYYRDDISDDIKLEQILKVENIIKNVLKRGFGFEINYIPTWSAKFIK